MTPTSLALVVPIQGLTRQLNDTAKFFAHANISAKLKPHAQLFQYEEGTWLGLNPEKTRGKIPAALS